MSIGLISAVLLLSSCEEDFKIEPPTRCDASPTIEATIHLFLEMDCGFIIELKDGTQLNPVDRGCFVGSFFPIEPSEGKKIKIEYRMMGHDSNPECPLADVEIICIEEIESIREIKRLE